MQEQTYHPDDVKIAVLTAREAGATLQEISEAYHVPLGTVSVWCSPNQLKGINSYHLEMARQNRVHLADRLEQTLHDCLDAAPEKLEKAHYGELAQMIKAGVPAMRLLRNESTANVAVGTVEERDSRLLELMQKALERKQGNTEGVVDTHAGACTRESGGVELEQVETPPGGERG